MQCRGGPYCIQLHTPSICAACGLSQNARTLAAVGCSISFNRLRLHWRSSHPPENGIFVWGFVPQIPCMAGRIRSLWDRPLERSHLLGPWHEQGELRMEDFRVGDILKLDRDHVGMADQCLLLIGSCMFFAGQGPKRHRKGGRCFFLESVQRCAELLFLWGCSHGMLR